MSVHIQVKSYPYRRMGKGTGIDGNTCTCTSLTCQQNLGIRPKLAGYDYDSYAEHKRKLTFIVTLSNE